MRRLPLTSAHCATLLAVMMAGNPAAGWAGAEPVEHLASATQGADAETDIRTRLKQADQLFSAGDRAGALVLMAQARQRAREHLGPEAPLTLQAELDHGATLMHLGRLPESRGELEPLLEKATRVLGAQHPIALDTLNNLANLVDYQEGTHRALPLYERAYQLRRQVQGEIDVHAIHSLNDLAYGLMQTGELHRALPLMQRVVQLRLQTQGPAHPWTLTAYNNLGVLYERLGRHSESRLQHETALRLRLEHLGERHPETLVSMNNLARLLHDAGATADAVDFVGRAIKLMQESLPPRHQSTLDAQQNLATFLAQSGKPAEARAGLEQVVADRAATQSVDHPRRLAALVSLAEVLIDLGEPGLSQAAIDEAETRLLATAGETHPLLVSARAARARLLLDIAPARAADLAEQAALAATHVLGEGHEQTIALHTLHLQARMAAGQWQRAVEDVPRLLRWLEQSHAAIPASDTGLRLRWQLRNRLAFQVSTAALIRAGRLDAAWAVTDWARARNLQDALDDRTYALAAGVPVARWQKLQEQREQAAGLGLMLNRPTATAERQRLLAVRGQALEAAQRLEEELRLQHPRYKSWETSPLAVQATEPDAMPPKASSNARIAFVVLDGPSATAGVSRDAVLGALVKHGSSAVAWVALGPARELEGTARALATWTSQLGQRFATDPSGRRLAILKLPTASSSARWEVHQLGDHCADRTVCSPQAQEVWGEQAYAEVATALSNRLLGPLRPHLRGSARWVISADPRFALVPWDVLPWNGKPLAASISVVLESRGGPGLDDADRQARPLRKLWAIGNPPFGGAGPDGRRAAARAVRSALRAELIPTASLDEMGRLALAAKPWTPLPGTAQELSLAAMHFRRAGGSASVATGPLATESRVREASANGELKRADVLLFSTHAFFNEREPRQSAVVLHREGTQADRDGYLTPTEIVGLNLDAAVSVVSGCSSGMGASANGDAAAGFAYALKLAGSRSNVLTLWPVNDRAAAAFVSLLMDRLASGQEPPAALHETKRAFMQHRNPAFRSPRHWAGFVLHGF